MNMPSSQIDFPLLPYQHPCKRPHGEKVQWFREGSSSLIVKIGKTALGILALLGLSLTVVGIAWIIKGFKQYHQIQKLDQFQKASLHFLRPPQDLPVELKTPTMSFTHCHDFVIFESNLWTRRRHHPGEWKPVCFPGSKPIRLSADGANLTVTDESGKIYYKKILQEFRSNDQLPRHYQRPQGSETPYVAIDKSENYNWKEQWFSLPYLHPLVNLLTGKFLREQNPTFKISHRGRFSNGFRDAADQNQPVQVGVTTAFALQDNKIDFIKEDPWKPLGPQVYLSLPETANSTKHVLGWDAAGSVLATIGYHLEQKNEQTTSSLEVLTNLSDIDVMGSNPFLKYAYKDVYEPKPDVKKPPYVIPLAQWQSHPLLLTEDRPIPSFSLSEQLTIFQTGEGNHAREIRIRGVYQKKRGYYYKTLDDRYWKFQAMALADSAFLLPSQNSAGAFTTSVHDYQGSDQNKFPAKLINFGARSNQSTLDLKWAGEVHQLPIYRRIPFKNYIGLSGYSYDLVIPKALQQNTNLMKLWKNQTVIPLKISERGSCVKLQALHHQLVFEQIGVLD